MTVVTLITQRSFGIIVFFHTTQAFSGFFSPYGLSQGSWKASMAPSNSKHDTALTSWTRGREGAEGPAITKASSPGKSWVRREGVTGPGTWSLLSSFKTGTCCHLVPITASMQRDLPMEAPRWKRTRLRPCVLGAQRMFPAYHNYKNICAQQLSVELLWKFTVFDCFQNFSLLSLRQGGLQAARELLQEVREITISSVWMKCSIRVWGLSLEPWVLQISINDHFFFLLYSIKTYMLSMMWTDFTMDQSLSKSRSSKSQ